MTVVCLGYREGFARAAERRGLPVHFVVEKDKTALRSHRFTKVSDLAATEEILRAVLRDVDDKVTAVVTGHEQALFSVAALRGVFGTPGDADLRTAVRFRDKWLQKASLPSSVSRAGCEYLPRDAPRYDELAARLGPRLVVKPADGHGSQRTELVRDQAALDTYRERNPTVSDVQTVVESFVEGYEIHVDGVWLEGRLLWGTVSKYLGPLMNWTEGAPVGDCPLGDAAPELQSAAIDLTVETLGALRAPDTVFHLEAFVDGAGKLHLGEVAARMVGALTPEILLFTFGVDLYDVALDLALGVTPQVPATGPAPEALYGFVYLARDPRVPLTEQGFRDRFDLVECEYPAESEGRVGSYGRWGHAVVTAPTHEKVVQALNAVALFNRGA